MPVQKAEALFDFIPTASVELELKKGNVVIVRRMSVGEGWWEGEIDGKRGLFPSSFVKLLPASGCGSPERAKTPLTPRTSKKAFMETLLSPAQSTQDLTYDVDKATELFVPGHTNVAITAGPQWDCKPPELTVVINDLQTESRFSGMKHTTLYQVETEELGATVTRKHKHFLWLYDRLAENFPCISLPPLPVKHLSASEGVEAKRKALEKFLNRVARHPVLASTKLFRDFLLQKDDKDWKIGRHSSHIRMPKSAKKLFNAPVYATIRYPPYNVPLHQLASIERFSRFSRTLEMNVSALQQSYAQLSMVHGEAMTGVNLLGRDLQRFARGLQQPTTAATGFQQRRKLAGLSSVQQLGITVSTNGQPTHHHHIHHPSSSSILGPRGATPTYVSQRGAGVGGDLEEEDSGDEEDCSAWNWRDDTRFDHMVKDLHDLATGIRHTGHIYTQYQAALERVVFSNLEDYSGIIHTLPILVKLHEDAMEVFNYSKEKDSKREAEEVRQNCETLNNILLAEFDYFSDVMIDDFEEMMSNFLLEQASLHRQLAEEWESLHTSYAEKRSQRTSSTLSGSRKRAHSSPHYSYSTSVTSSQESSTSLPTNRDSKSSTGSQKSSLTKSLSAATASVGSASGPMGVPTYINVQPMSPNKEESDSDIDEDLLPATMKKPGASASSSSQDPQTLEAGDDAASEGASLNDTLIEQHDYALLEEDPFHSKHHDYAVLEEETFAEKDGAGDVHLPEGGKGEEGGGGGEVVEDVSSHPEYANMEYLVKSGSITSSSCSPPSASEAAAASFLKKLPKKPMPIQRNIPKIAAFTTSTSSVDGALTQQEEDCEQTNQQQQQQQQHCEDDTLCKSTTTTTTSTTMPDDKQSTAANLVSPSSIPKKPLAPPQTRKPQLKKQSAPETTSPLKPTKHSGSPSHQRPVSPRPFTSYQTTRVATEKNTNSNSRTTTTQAIAQTTPESEGGGRGGGGGMKKSPELPQKRKTTDIVDDLASITGNGVVVTGKKPAPKNLPMTVHGGKPRSYTTVEQRKQPLLPKTAKPNIKSSSHSPKLPAKRARTPEAVLESTEQSNQTSAMIPSQPAKSPTSSAPPVKTPGTDTPTGRDELMRKLSLRRIKIEQQLALNPSSSSSSSVSPFTASMAAANGSKDSSTGSSSFLTETSSSRTSTSSSQSEVVVAYKRIEDGLALSSNGGVQLRKGLSESQDKDDGLSKFGILEDKEGGSFLI